MKQLPTGTAIRDDTLEIKASKRAVSIAAPL
jgi:hypothetical protein